MKELNDMQLVLKVEGQVVASNMKEFEDDSLEILLKINTNLVTDADFIEAKGAIKSIKTVETRIEQAKQDGIMSMADVAELMTIASRVFDKFRATRLMLEKTVKAEESRRKTEIVQAGIDQVKKKVSGSWVAPAMVISLNDINSSIKGKKSLAKMEEAVSEAVGNILHALQVAEEIFAENVVQLSVIPQEHVGLFSDWKTLCMAPVETVAMTITARIEKHKNDLREAADRKAAAEKLAADQKAERERAAAQKLADDAKIAEAQPAIKAQETIKQPEVQKVDPPANPFQELPVDPFTTMPSFPAAPPEPQMNGVVYILVAVDSAAIQEVTVWIKGLEGVVDVNPYLA